MVIKKHTLVADYRKLINNQQGLENELRNVQRERDLKVDAINSKYQFEIDRIMRDLEMTKLIIEASKKFVEEN